jgi:hypothetical protein
MLNKKTRVRFYQKAPVKFLLERARSLKKLAVASFIFSLLFVFLSNPFLTFAKFKNLPNTLNDAKDIISNIPEFIKNLPQETEKNTFAFFIEFIALSSQLY